MLSRKPQCGLRENRKQATPPDQTEPSWRRLDGHCNNRTGKLTGVEGFQSQCACGGVRLEGPWFINKIGELNVFLRGPFISCSCHDHIWIVKKWFIVQLLVNDRTEPPSDQ